MEKDLNFFYYKGAWISQFPPHKSCLLPLEVCLELLKQGGLLLRDIYDWDCGYESSFWFVIKDSFGRMKKFSTKMRNQVKKSLKTYVIRKVSPEEILKIGFLILKVAIDNYIVKVLPITEKAFVERIQKL